MSPGDSPDQDHQDENLETLCLTDSELAIVQDVAKRQGVTVEEALSSALSADLRRRFAPQLSTGAPGTVVPLKRG